MLGDIGKLLIVFGGLLLLIGIGLLISSKIPFLGKLPGDIFYKNGNMTFYFPLATSLLISILLTLLFNFFNRK